VNRKLLQSDMWLDEPFTRGQAWLDMFGLANHAAGFIRVRGIRVEIQRGQLGWSQERLAIRWKWSRGKIRRFLKELEISDNIVQQNGHLTTIISICNYDYWQGETVQQTVQQAVQQTDSKRYTNNKQQGTTMKNKEIYSSTNADLKELFSELVGLLGFTDAVKYTDGRKRKLQVRLSKCSADELRRAAQAIADDAYMQGDNQAGRRYGDIDYLIRSDEQVDKWIQRSETKLKDLKEYI
jgi:preprotein translocase subunit SecF